MKPRLKAEGSAMCLSIFSSRYSKGLLFFVVFLLSPAAQAGQSEPTAQGTPSLQEQLQARYPLAEMSTAGGCSIRNPETALVVMQSGITTFEESSFPRACAIHYKDGKLKPPGFRCKYTGYYGGSSFGKGDKVYPVDLKVEKEEVTMTLGYCSPRSALSYSYKTKLVFEFSSSFLSSANTQQVEDKIEELLSKDLTKAAPTPTQQQHSDNGQNNSPKPSPEPQSVEEGMSPDQVVAILGKPDIIAKKGGDKLVYVYNSKKLKIVFINGKMSDFE
jgi:hypothetical protein